MKCKNCNNLVKRTLSDNCVSRFKFYKTVAYYYDHCDKIYILEKYKDVIAENKYDSELEWLRDENPYLNK
ncbi:hypothetical protein [uncultured Fusobacterium sp.]|uniref:hypothetical protein n=1 Tax=uncultured Fusobacterium sp. TaxID=159267 RepID=UPI0025F8E5EE|nr:hypothetical protein [uncultured Fusobacterium sp.]